MRLHFVTPKNQAFMRVNPESFFSFEVFTKPAAKKKNAFSCGAQERCVRICLDKDRSARGKKSPKRRSYVEGAEKSERRGSVR
jgi:hypothetical protein